MAILGIPFREIVYRECFCLGFKQTQMPNINTRRKLSTNNSARPKSTAAGLKRGLSVAAKGSDVDESRGPRPASAPSPPNAGGAEQTTRAVPSLATAVAASREISGHTRGRTADLWATMRAHKEQDNIEDGRESFLVESWEDRVTMVAPGINARC